MKLLRLRFERSENQTFEEEANDEDFYKELFTDPYLNWSTLVLYFLGLVICGILGIVSKFERSGLAGPYRTVINRLISFVIDQAILIYALGSGIDQLRQLWGPLNPVICRIGTVVKQFANVNLVQLITSITGVRFCFVCVYKHMPVMDDSFVALVIYMSTSLFSLLFTTGRLYTNQNYMPYEKICIGENFQDSDEVDPPMIIILAIGLIAIMIILNMVIAWKQRKIKVGPLTNHLSQAQVTEMADMTAVIISVICIGTSIFASIKVVKELSMTQNKRIMHALSAAVNPFFRVLIAMVYFMKKKQVRKFVRETLNL